LQAKAGRNTPARARRRVASLAAAAQRDICALLPREGERMPAAAQQTLTLTAAALFAEAMSGTLTP